MQILKTAYPLLSLSMETTVDQLSARLKPSADEELYRLVCLMANDADQAYMSALAEGRPAEMPAPSLTMSIERFLRSPYMAHGQFKDQFEEDLVKSRPNLEQLCMKYRYWQRRLERFLESRPKKLNLENLSSYLVQFEFQKFDEIEVPGQYLELRDNNEDFVKMERFFPQIDFVRGQGIWYKRITIIGHDGSRHTFHIHNPVLRRARREERFMQCFRLLNGVLEKRKETRRRNLSLHLPWIVPLAPTVRLIQDDPSYVSLQDIHDQWNEKEGHSSDRLFVGLVELLKKCGGDPSINKGSLETEFFADVSPRLVPDTIMKNYFRRSMKTFGDYWLLRKNVTMQFAMTSFMSYILSAGYRTPQKLLIAQSSGRVWSTDMLPTLNSNFMFHNPEAVPFRLTPNMQEFISETGMDGPFVGVFMALAHALTEPGVSLDIVLCDLICC
jgi:transformation/transcription domain-associated protein